MNSYKAVIFGCAGTELSSAEYEFFAESRPMGFILFSRNCKDPLQVSNLTSQLRESIDNNAAPILIDQEGGSVVRLRPPYWRRPPAAKVFADMAKSDIDLACEALNLNIRLIGKELRTIGINVDCLPVLDIPSDGAHPIIGDRALGTSPEMIDTAEN